MRDEVRTREFERENNEEKAELRERETQTEHEWETTIHERTEIRVA